MNDPSTQKKIPAWIFLGGSNGMSGTMVAVAGASHASIVNPHYRCNYHARDIT